ncbi:hypothetical protein BPS26883_04677 [Burkholderia pseudomultivorans]|uniref:Uncharacterized protein n=1 Tax=Burkholderia pseudomultivorans TaxID=1207504 RepID=A0A6P2NQC1_9BURK|nr:hypothetical protein [Burkholderia pseudomultivorans]VWB96693.1 hypothetical protein BPS26883_04677 [Burkholderia pseudomultivorans]
MAKPSLTRVQYIEMVNERMREHPQYTREMHVHFYPKGIEAEHASGIYIEGPPEARGVLADTDAKIFAEYDFEGLPAK